ncbi:MAG TPA: MFS transporter [Dongiaceae bacterium]|nr:MFS transporter [Dongiaceae bacterium]
MPAVAGVFRSLRVFNYRLWAAGALISNIGTWMQRTAQDWLVYADLTHHDAAAVGTVMALQYAPQFLLLPWTGYAADRLNQRKLLLVTQAAMGGLALGLGAITVAGIAQLWHVYVFAFLSGCAAAFDAPVRQTFVAELVGDQDLPNAVALNSTSFNASRMIGPAVAGIVIAEVGSGWAFLINGASFTAVLLSLSLLRVSELRPNARSARTRGGFAEGLRYVWARRDLKAILLMLFVIGTFGLNFPIFISTMAVKVFHADARGYGVLSSTMAIGTMAGALLAAGRDRPGFPSLLTASGIFGVACALAAIAPSYWTFGAILIVVGVAALSFTNATNSLMQLSTDPAMRGRVMAFRIGVAFAGTPVGAPIVGWVADHAGPRWSLGVGALSGFAAAIVAAYALSKKLHRLPGEQQAT